MNGHVTEDQITEIIVEGLPPASCREHLAECSGCRARVDEAVQGFGMSVADFNQASLAWSEAQPSHRLVVPARRSVGLRLMPAALGLAMAAAVFVAVQGGTEPKQQPMQMADSSAQIADDDALLRSVNLALAVNDSSPLEEYDLGEPGPAREAAVAR